MIELYKSIYGKLSGSSLATDIGGRLYKGEAPQEAEFPYVVYFIVSDVPEYPGGKTIEQVLLQFSLFSSASGSTEIEGMLTHLRTLYDDVVLTITGYTSIFFIRGNHIAMREDVTTVGGTAGVWHYAQDYELWIVK
jgi:hypothetical protein